MLRFFKFAYPKIYKFVFIDFNLSSGFDMPGPIYYKVFPQAYLSYLLISLYT